MHLFTLKTSIEGPLSNFYGRGSVPTWVSNTPAGQPAPSTRNVVFDLGTEWTSIDGLMIIFRADLTGITGGSSPSIRAHGADTTSILADGSGRLAQMWGSTIFSVGTSLSSNTSVGGCVVPRGRYLIVTVDGSAMTGTTIGANSALEVTAFKI